MRGIGTLMHGPLYEINCERYQPRALVIDLVRQCTERCMHCVVAAAPDRRERLAANHVADAIADAARHRFASVSFYGGEPFVAKQELYDAVMQVFEHGMHPQIMTNGFWGRSAESAARMFDTLHALRPHPESRLAINVSTDEFHTQVPLSSIGNIVAAWARSPDGVDLNLAVGNSGLPGYVQDTMNTVLGHADAQLEAADMRTCDYRHPLSGDYGVGIVDKVITVRDGETPGAYIDQLEREEMLPSGTIELLRSQDFNGFRDFFLFLRHNAMALLVQNERDAAQGTCRVGRYKPGKIMQFRSYTINLFGAGRELQADDALRARIAEARSGGDREVNLHEYRSLLMLGNDNKFYASPIHLHHRVRPLGENTGNAIGDVIRDVNDGEMVSGILRMQDVTQAKFWLLQSGDTGAYDRFCALEEEGLVHEALEEFLLSKKTMAAMPRHSSLYRAR